MKFYVYELIDPRDDKPFYVGKGKGARIDRHETEARSGRQSRKCQRIRDIEAEGLKIIKRKVSHHECEVEAFSAEAELIAFYGSKRLTNVLAGGRGGRSLGPTAYEDRRTVMQAAALAKRCVSVAYIEIFGERFDINKSLRAIVEKVISRRTLEWVNQVAASQRVEFRYGEARTA